MIKNITWKSIKANIYLESGTVFYNRDVPTTMFGENERFVSFWVDDVLLIYPLNKVKHIEIIEDKRDQE